MRRTRSQSPPRRSNRARTGTALLASALLSALLVACSTSGTAVGGGAGTPGSTTSTHPDTPAAPAPSGTPTVEWHDCSLGDCALVPVPVDHDDPDGPTLDIALARTSVADPDRRIGSLLVNPGGPGGSGVELASYLTLPDELADRFDLVGFDPRGVGSSTALDCHTHLQAMYDANPNPDDEETTEDLLSVSRAFVDECEERHGDLLPHLGTNDVARDLDLIRRALGEERLDYLGFSYGTLIGQQYARLFPGNVRTMVLDGVVDPAMGGLEGAAFQAAGFETAFDSFAAWCDEDDCVGGDTREVLEEVLDDLRKEPIPAPYADRPATAGNAFLGVAQALYAEWMWQDLATAIRQARGGDGSEIVELADDYLGRRWDEYPNTMEVYFAVNCVDSDWPDDPEEFFEFARDVARDAPLLGEALVNDYVRCAFWPADPNPVEPIPSDVEGLAPILIVSTTGDPATPHEAAVDLAGSIPGARLLTHHGEGHTIAFRGNACVDEPIVDYLIDGVPPDGDLEC